MTSLRRVVTGHSGDGNAVFASDEEVEPISLPGASTLHRIWAADDAPTFPDDGSEPETSAYWPPVGGFRYLLMTIAPSDGPETRSTIDAHEINRLMPGLVDVMELP